MNVEAELVEEEPSELTDKVEKAKTRMLNWPNPVEYVNNMYGCHPDNLDENGKDYFKHVFGDE